MNVTRLHLLSIFSLGFSLAAMAQEEALEPTSQTTIAPPPAGQDRTNTTGYSTWQKSGLIAEDLAAVLGELSEVPEERRSRVLLLAESAYRGNHNEEIWVKEARFFDFTPLYKLLNLHGLDKSELISSRRPPKSLFRFNDIVSIDDLHKTLRLADICILLRDGPVSMHNHWPKWIKGDQPGEGDHKQQTTALRQAFSDLLQSTENIEAKVPQVFAPKNWVYHVLQRKLVAEKPSELDMIRFPKGSLRIGSVFPEAHRFAEYLVIAGHLSPDLLSQIETTYNQELSDAVASLQRSRGLEEDGVLGAYTLNVLKGERSGINIEKLKLNLNRARLLPSEMGDRYLLANIPSGEVHGVEDGLATIRMRIVFGEAEADRQTPFFRDEMTTVIFRPYWMLPNEISKNEYLPQIFRDRSYLQRNGYKVVDYTGKIYENTYDNLKLVEKGDLYLRQEGGATNALGNVKFLFPNPHYVYFHDTPEKHFFNYSYRAQSHGCVRLQKPREMAYWILKNHRKWDEKSINQAMASGQRTAVSLYSHVPIYITYFTTFPDPEDANKIGEFDDLYKMD